jgi:hypothetical protein
MMTMTTAGGPVAPPVSRLAAVIDLGPAVGGSPDEVAGIAERMRPGNGTSVLEYVRDLERAFAIPILGVTEYPGLCEAGAAPGADGRVREGGCGGPDPVDYGASSFIPSRAGTTSPCRCAVAVAVCHRPWPRRTAILSGAMPSLPARGTPGRAPRSRARSSSRLDPIDHDRPSSD